MKRIILALMILLLAGVCFYGLSQRAGHVRRRLVTAQAGLLTQTRRLEEIQADRAALESKVHDLKRALLSTEPVMPVDLAISEIIRTNGLSCLSKEMRQEFLARLGFIWDSSDDYVLVHKAALKGVRPNLLKMERLADVPCAVLAITPEERQQVDAAFAKSWDEFGVWAKTNIYREGRSGDMLVSLTIPGSDEVARRLTNDLSSAIASDIGAERAELLGSFAYDWLRISAANFADVTNTLTVLQRHDDSGRPELLYQQRGRVSGAPSKIDPEKFPPAWKTVFPGGWAEVAQREGFELPEVK